MVGGDVNAYPILLLVNYWEIRPSLIGSRLDELLRRGVTQVGTYIPWQVAESDISHTNMLTRFLQAAAERRINVFLILSPEVGVHYPNSGLPKDVILKKENMAQHSDSGPVVTNLPPNLFNLPSLFASEYNKRYYSFIGRIDGVLSDLAKNQPGLMKNVTAVLSGSFWKYYRSPRASSQSPFGGNCGDYSPQATQSFRQRMEHFFSQREFMDPTPSAANQWKMRSLEEINRRWFYQHSEDVFRSRSCQTLRKRSSGLRLLETEIFTPEADPSTVYTNFLQMISGGAADFTKLSAFVDEAAQRASNGGISPTVPFIHWTSMGGFRLLSDSEKQFLILKSLLLFGGQGGGILLDDSEWLSMSSTFRARTDALAQSLSQGDLKLKNRALYLSPHLWSYHGILWEELSKEVGPHMRMVTSMNLVTREQNAHLLIVDPAMILTREMVQKLLAWAKAGRIVVMPRNPFYTELAKTELEQSLVKSKRIEVDMGFTYRLYALEDGKLLVYDVPGPSALKGEPLSSWQSFTKSILSIAEVENYCQASDPNLTLIPLERDGDGLAVFVLNGTRQKVAADLIFTNNVQIGDLGAALAGGRPAYSVGPDGSISEPPVVALANRFTMEVPTLGVLPLSVDGLHISVNRERHSAALISRETRENAMTAAGSELPGLNSETGLGELWT